jgi:hypothetical protein
MGIFDDISDFGKDVVKGIGDVVKGGIKSVTEIQNEVNDEVKGLIDSGAINQLIASSTQLATQPVGIGVAGAGTAAGVAGQTIGQGVGTGLTAGIQGTLQGMFAGIGGAFGLEGSTMGYIIFGVGAILVILLLYFSLQ